MPLNCRLLMALQRADSSPAGIYRSSAYLADGLAQPAALSSEIRWFVNLRGAEEASVSASADWFAQFRRIDSPIVCPWPSHVGTDPDAHDYAAWYEAMLTSTGKAFATAFCAVAAVAAEGVIFACQHGKDRTGLLAAAILEAVGTPRELILADYAKSGAHLTAHGDVFLRSWEKRQMSREAYLKRFNLGDAPLRHLYRQLGEQRATPILDAISAASSEQSSLRQAISKIRAIATPFRAADV